MDVGENSSLGDDDGTEETVELFIVPNGELQVTGNDTGLLVVTKKETRRVSIRNIGWKLQSDSERTERRFQLARGSQRRGTRGRQPSRLFKGEMLVEVKQTTNKRRQTWTMPSRNIRV